MLIIKHERFFNYFNIFIGVAVNYFDKININCFDKHLRKIFTNVNIADYLNKLEVNTTTKIVEIDTHECLFFFIVKNMKLIANSE